MEAPGKASGGARKAAQQLRRHVLRRAHTAAARDGARLHPFGEAEIGELEVAVHANLRGWVTVGRRLARARAINDARLPRAEMSRERLRRAAVVAHTHEADLLEAAALHDVLRLQIAINDLLRVDVLEGQDDLGRVDARPLLCEAAVLLQQSEEITTTHEIPEPSMSERRVGSGKDHQGATESEEVLSMRRDMSRRHGWAPWRTRKRSHDEVEMSIVLE